MDKTGTVKNVAVTFKMKEGEVKQMDLNAQRANMTRSDYIRNAVCGNVVSYVDHSKETLSYVMDLTKCLIELKEKHPNIKVSPIIEKGYELCRQLNSQVESI